MILKNCPGLIVPLTLSMIVVTFGGGPLFLQHLHLGYLGMVVMVTLLNDSYILDLPSAIGLLLVGEADDGSSYE